MSCRVRSPVRRKFGSASEASSRAHRCTCSAAWCSRSALAASSRRIRRYSLSLCWLALALALLLPGLARTLAHGLPRHLSRGASVSISSLLPCTSAYLSLCPWFDLCRRLICPQSHCSIFPRCSPPFVLRLVLPPACSTATRPVCFLDPHTYTHALLYLYLHTPNVMRIAALHRTTLTMAR